MKPRTHLTLLLTSVVLLGLAAGCAAPPPVTALQGGSGSLPEAPACPLLPADTYWYARADGLPVHPQSAQYVASIGLEEEIHADFGSGEFEGGPIGIPYVVVPGDQPRVDVAFEFADESDPGPYPIPPDPPIEGGPDGDGDRHILIVDRDACVLYEVFNAFPDGDGTWSAGSGAVFDLDSYALRPDTWTSADAAGLPMLPGLVRFDEVAAGAIEHAIRITVPDSAAAYVWPARHEAGIDDPSLPPMGLWLRLRADVDLSGLGPQAQVVARALQTYGAIVADNGSPWFISGAPDERWDNDDLRTLSSILGSSWEAVDSSSLQVDPDSAQAAIGGPPPPPPPPGGGRETGRVSGPDRIATAVAISQRAFPGGAPVAYLANAATFVDAVAGGTLTDGPVLLVPQCGELPAVVAAEIARVDPAQVLSLGGPAAVCDELLAQAASA